MNRYELCACAHCGEPVLVAELRDCPFLGHGVCAGCQAEAQRVIGVCGYVPRVRTMGAKRMGEITVCQ